jgi:hypothetical protein
VFGRDATVLRAIRARSPRPRLTWRIPDPGVFLHLLFEARSVIPVRADGAGYTETKPCTMRATGRTFAFMRFVTTIAGRRAVGEP